MKLSEQIQALIVALIADANKIVKAAIALNRDMTADEAKRVDEIHAQVEQKKKDKARAERQEALDAEVGAPQPRLTADLAPGVVTPPATPRIEVIQPRIYGRIKNAKTTMEAYRFGVWACAALGFTWARAKANELFGSKALQIAPEAILSEGVNTAGGYLVPEEFLNTMIDLREKYGVIRRKAKIIPMTRDTLSIPRRTGGLTAYPVGEGVAGTESNKSWDRVGLTAKKWMVLTRMTKELSEDSIVNIGDDLMGEVAYAFAYAEDNAGFNGDGTSTYGGIVGIKNALHSNAQMAQGTSNTWAAMVIADFNNLMAKVPDYTTTPSPEFYCNKAFYHSVMERVAYAMPGTAAIDVVNGITQARFLSYPVNFVTVMPNATATSGIMCYFGDLAAAVALGDRRQVTISMSDSANVGGDSMWETDEIGIKGTERFDINVHERGSAVTNRPLVALKTS